MSNDEVGTGTPEDSQASDVDAQNIDTEADAESSEDEATLVGRLRGQRDHFRKKAERLEAQLGQPQTQTKESQPAPASTSDPAGIDRLTAIELKTEGYSKEEIAEIVKYSKGAGVSVEEATNSPFVKTAISAMREQARIAEGTPSPSGRAAAIVINEKPVEALTRDEHKANYQQIRAKAIANRTGNRGNSSRV